MRKVTDELGSTALEKKQMLQLADMGRQLFEKKYAAKGWTNDLAGAMTFFIVVTATVHTGKEPDPAAQDRLFSSLTNALGQSELARASAEEKTALYDTLVTCGGMPLLFFLDGTAQKDANELKQARALVTTFSKKLLGAEPVVVAGML